MENQLRRALSLFCPDSYCDGRVRSTWGQKATRPYGYYTLLAISSTCLGRGFDQLVRRIDELTGSFPIESLYSLTDLFLIGETYQPQTWTVSLCVSSPLPRTPPAPFNSVYCVHRAPEGSRTDGMELRLQVDSLVHFSISLFFSLLYCVSVVRPLPACVRHTDPLLPSNPTSTWKYDNKRI